MKPNKLMQSMLALALLATVGGACNSSTEPAASTTTTTSKPMDHAGGSPSEQMHSMMMQPMKNMNMSGNVDKDFATMMADHHQQGVDMARVEIEHGQSAEMKKMAQMIIDTQLAEKEQLLKIAGQIDATAKQTDASNKMHMAMMKPMPEMTLTKNTDKDFALLMAVHHEMAVKMVDIELASGMNAELKAMAQKMKDMQLKEIAELRKFAKAG